MGVPLELPLLLPELDPELEPLEPVEPPSEQTAKGHPPLLPPELPDPLPPPLPDDPQSAAAHGTSPKQTRSRRLREQVWFIGLAIAYAGAVPRPSRSLANRARTCACA
jgi:hypothetical protein